MKNERLLDTIGSVSPEFIQEAAPGNIPKRTVRRTRMAKRLLAVAAVLVLLLAAAMATIGISAEEEQPLQELPAIILEEDFDLMIREMYMEFENKDEFMDLSHYALRCVSFYEYFDLSQCKTDRAKEALLERAPIAKLSNVYILDETATDVDKEWLLDQFRSISFSQNDLIECYERMYELVENSDVENKEEILVSLPDIPERPDQDK